MLRQLTYAEAAKQVRGQTKDQRVQSGVPTEGNNEVLEEYIMVKKKKKMVTFFAGVTNSTAGIESKDSAVMAAICHLGLTGLTWEEVRDELQIR